jgi:hypothetical protein
MHLPKRKRTSTADTLVVWQEMRHNRGEGEREREGRRRSLVERPAAPPLCIGTVHSRVLVAPPPPQKKKTKEGKHDGSKPPEREGEVRGGPFLFFISTSTTHTHKKKNKKKAVDKATVATASYTTPRNSTRE